MNQVNIVHFYSTLIVKGKHVGIFCASIRITKIICESLCGAASGMENDTHFTLIVVSKDNIFSSLKNGTTLSKGTHVYTLKVHFSSLKVYL